MICCIAVEPSRDEMAIRLSESIVSLYPKEPNRWSGFCTSLTLEIDDAVVRHGFCLPSGGE